MFTLTELEKSPSVQVSSRDLYEMVPSGSANLPSINPFNQAELNETLQSWRERCQQRRVELYQPFQQFDRHNRGHVTRVQFRQCLAIAGVNGTDRQLECVESAFVDDIGFNYRAFLRHVQPFQVDSLRYQTLQQELKDLNGQKVLPEIKPLTSIQDVLQKIKGQVRLSSLGCGHGRSFLSVQVFRRRIRLYEWLKDHDKLNSGRLPCDTFRRAINPCQLELTESELSLLED